MEQKQKAGTLKRKYEIITCLLLGVVALAVRLYGIRYGLPFPLKADEPYIIDSAVGNFYSESPMILGWPGSLLVLILFCFYSLYFFYLKFAGVLTSVQDFIFMYWDDPSTLYLLGRVFVAVTGATTVVILYRMMTKMYDRTSALVSSLFLTFAFMHARHSHFALPDIPMTLALVALVYLAYRILKGTGLPVYIAAGALCGFAAALKFNSVIIIIPLLLSFLFREQAPEKGDWKKPASMITSSLLFFYLGCPYILTDPGAVLESIRNVVIWQKEIGNIRAIPVGSPVVYLLGTILPKSVGFPMVVLALAGTVLLLVKVTKRDIILLSYPVLYILLLSTSKTMFLRYAIPLIPFMAILAALFITRVTGWIDEGVLRNAVFIVLFGIVLIPQAWKTILFDHMLTRTDTRTQARNWIVEQLPGGSSIMLDHVPFSVPMGFNEWVLNYEMRRNRWDELKYRYLKKRSGEKVNSFKLKYTSGKITPAIWDFDPQYVIVSSYVKNLFYGTSGENLRVKMPGVYDRRRAFYERVEENGEMLMMFSPTGTKDEEFDDVYGVMVNPEPGPVIRIYRIKENSTG